MKRIERIQISNRSFFFEEDACHLLENFIEQIRQLYKDDGGDAKVDEVENRIAELCYGKVGTDGLVTAVVYKISSHRGRSVVKSLLAGMLSGRVVWGIVSAVMNHYTFGMVMTEGFINAIPGIIIQMFVVSLVIYGLKVIHKVK